MSATHFIERFGTEISPWSPDYFWGGLNPRSALSTKERAKRNARRKMADASRRRNRR